MRIFKPSQKPILKTTPKTVRLNFCDFWNDYDKENNRFIDILRKYYTVEISDTPEFLFYSCFGREFENFENSVKIFVTGENFVPNYNKCDYGISFDNIKFEDRHLRFNFMYGFLKNKRKITKDLADRKFCNFIYSNAENGEGALLRQEFFKKLSEYKHIDAPGKVCNNMTNAIEGRYGKTKGPTKLEFIRNYKFTIAFENSKSAGYTTEKLFHPLDAFSIPIYWGNPDIVKDINPKSFINCNDYNDFDRVIKRVIELDNNDREYLNMLKEKPLLKNSYLRNQNYELEKFLVNIIEKGNVPFTKDPLNIEKW